MEGLVVFLMGRQAYALPTRSVLELARMVLLSTSPDDTGGVLAGVVTYRGRVLPVIDLHGLVRQPQTADLLRQSIVFVRTDDQAEFGICVDDVVDVLPEQDDEAATAITPGKPPVQCSIAIGERLIQRLDLAWLGRLTRSYGGVS
ncbi:MAG: chemotaxis protein CheW [Planctomycetota bacterium]